MRPREPARVNEYLLLPLLAAMGSAALAVGILLRDPGHRTNQLGAALMACAALWAACEVAWNTCSDPDVALRWMRLSSLGWVAIGPLALHLMLELAGDPRHRLRRALPFAYAASLGFLAVTLATPWMHEAVVRTSWGWGYRFGPAYPAFYALTVACLSAVLALGVRHFVTSSSAGERSQARWLVAGVIVPLVVASATDGLLPLFGWQPPRLGTASFTFLGATIAWGFHRYGYSLLAPGAFASDILEILPEGVALLRPDGRVRTANGGMAGLCGVEPRELEGSRFAELVRGIDLDASPELVEEECSLVAAGDVAVPVAISTAWLRDKQRHPIGLVLVARDLREVASLRSRLVTSDRLAAVGQLAAGIAHEINNPIAYVNANLGALRGLLEGIAAKLGPESLRAVRDPLRECQDLVDESQEGVQRVADIVRDVKSFSHAGGGPREAVELHPLLDAVLRVAAPQLRYGGRIERLYGDDVPPVRGDAQELKQVFLNLVINASHAVEGDQPIRLRTARAGERVVVEVEDEGCGIGPDVIGKIFDPFFTTKPVGEGTGLGLSIAYQIVRNHGGEVHVDSEPGRGTRVRVELPAAR